MKFKKIIAATAAALMMISVAMSPNMISFAESGPSITISNASGDSFTHTYKAYQILTGAVNSNGDTLSNISYGDGIDHASLITYLKNGNLLGFSSSDNITSASVFADKLSALTSDADRLSFAKILSGYIVNTKAISLTAGSSTSVAAGYYLIVDETALANGNETALSANILKVAGSVVINAKTSYPVIDKKIGTEFGSGVDFNTAAIGDDINYIIKSTVPDMSAYDKYYYTITDTLSAGLTYKSNLEVVIDKNTNGKKDEGDTAVASTNYSLNINNGVITIDFGDIKSKFTKDDNLLLLYSATLNENASLSTSAATANTNTVKLSHSYNPNIANSSTTVIDTKEKQVVTYTASLEITKTISGGTALPSSAEFKLTKTENESFVKTGNPDSKTGILEFKGLDPGTYTLEESVVPDGYNKAETLTLVISGTPAADKCTWSGSTGFILDTDTSKYKVSIVNNQGTILPGTGGIGTTVFYVSGGVLVVGAVVVMVTKKRMSLKDEKK